MTISAKETLKNHTDKECFAAASSCIKTRILTLLFSAQTTAFYSQPFIGYHVLEAAASQILKTLIKMGNFTTREQDKTLMLHIGIA